ncbi:hypothetical protein GCM10010522_44520 [Kribbella solani]|uniref:Uncharacterized protein n=1 Tax=Kribbella solani TaxID=236067 RepID=A0A841E1E2_9ACTN|nr:hypothetical protein [Kribbella solani]
MPPISQKHTPKLSRRLLLSVPVATVAVAAVQPPAQALKKPECVADLIRPT